MPKQSIVSRIGSLFSGRLVGDGVSFLFYVALVRRFGEAGIGDYASGFALAAVLSIGIGLGLRHLITRKIVQHPDTASSYPEGFLLLQGLSLLLLLVAMHVFARMAEISVELYWMCMLALLAHGIGKIAFSYLAMIEAAGAMSRSAMSEAGGKLTTAGLGFLLLWLGLDLKEILIAHVSGQIVFLLLAMHWARAAFGPFRLRLNFRLAFSLFLMSIPFALSTALYDLYARIDIIMVRSISGAVDAGAYAVAFRCIETGLALAAVVGFAVYPSLVVSSENDKDSVAEIYRNTLRWLSVVGSLGMVVLFLGAQPITRVLFGSNIIDAGFYLQVMSVLFFVGCIKIPLWRMLFANNQEGLQLKLQFTALLVNVTLNAVLIPQHGALGACIASIVSEALLAVCFLWVLRDFHPTVSTRIIIGLCVSVLIAVGLGITVQQYAPWPVTLAAASSAFLLVILLSQVIRITELRLFARKLTRLTHRAN